MLQDEEGVKDGGIRKERRQYCSSLDMSVIGCYFWLKERNVERGRLNSSIQQWMLCITYVRTYVEGGRCAC